MLVCEMESRDAIKCYKCYNVAITIVMQCSNQTGRASECKRQCVQARAVCASEGSVCKRGQ
jgi:hypothetical protein